MLRLSTDLAIIGSGPAGLALATLCARRGLEVVVLASVKQSSATSSQETLPPNARRILEQLGLSKVFIDLQFPGHYSTSSAWGTDVPSERSSIFSAEGHGWFVDRCRFDRRLLSVALQDGVSVFHRTRIGRVTYAARTWELILEQPSDITVSARWVVDATGRASCFARRVGARRYRIDNQICVSALCSTPACIPSTLRVESEQSGWWFVIPNTMHGALVSYFTDADLASRFWTSRIGWRQQLERTIFARSYADAVRTATVQVRGATTEYLSQFSGPGWLAVGDAAFASDPLSSHGLLLSFTSSLHACDAILDGGCTRDSARGYDQWLSHTLSAFLAMRRYFYSREQRWPESPFWQRRHENRYEHN